MTRGLPHAAVRLLAVLLLAAPALLLGALFPTPAQAADPDVSVSIDAMTPARPQPGGTVRLTGTITSTAAAELSNLQVAFWSEPRERYDTVAELAAAADTAAEKPTGERTNAGNVYVNVPSDEDRTLAPGQSTPFDITAEVDDLYLKGVDTTYLIGVHVRGRTAPTGPDVTLGRGRIFMPLVTTEPANALRMTTLVIITSAPSWVRTGVLADDHLAAELATGGRLRTLLTAAAHDDTSFAVDPAVVQEVQTMSQGYQVRRDGQTAPGTGQADATSWLSALTRLIRTGDAYRLPYGNPDLAALVHHDRLDILQTSTAAADTVPLTADLPLLVVPANGRADQATVDAAEALGPRAIVLSERSAPGSGPLLSGPGGSPIVVYASTALQGGPGPAPRNTVLKVRQRMLADTFAEASSADADSTLGRVRLVTTAQQATAAGPDDSVPWLKPSNLRDLLGGKPTDADGEYRYSDNARSAELSTAQVDAVNELREDYATYADLLIDSEAAVAEQRAVVSRGASSSWRGAEEDQQTYLRPIAETVENVIDERVALTAAPRVLTTGRDATFPITVVNNLPPDLGADGQDRNAVDVAIRFDSSNSQRLTVATQQVPGGVVAGASATENVAVQAKTNGTVRVVAQLITKSGRAIGRPLPIEVNATQAGTTGWIIAIAAGVVLLGTTGLRIKQVTRERAAAARAQTAPVSVSRPPEDIESGAERESLDV